MSYGYGGRPNPFDQRDGPADNGYNRAPPQAAFGQGPRPGGGGGGAPRYNQGPAMGRDEQYGTGNVEMASLTQNASSFGQGDPNAILNECREVDRAIDEIEQNLNQIRMLQERSLSEADSGGPTSKRIESLSAQTMQMYRGLTDRVRMIKSNPESRTPKNAPQVGRIDRRLKQAINDYQQTESGYRKKTQDQMARQYMIVNPDADERDVRRMVEDGGGQVFQQALMQGNRSARANEVLRSVQDRQKELQKIEQQMIELAQLFQDLDTLVIQQDVQIMNIEQKGEEVVENLDKGNDEIAVAVTTARATRKKKWICLGIVVAIILIIAIVIVIYVVVVKGNNGSKKRDLDVRLNNVEARSIVEFAGEHPVTSIYAGSKIVLPGKDYLGGSVPDTPLSRFAGGGRAMMARDASTVAEAAGDRRIRKIVNPGVDWQPQPAAGSRLARAVRPGVEWKPDSQAGVPAKRYVQWSPDVLTDN